LYSEDFDNQEQLSACVEYPVSQAPITELQGFTAKDCGAVSGFSLRHNDGHYQEFGAINHAMTEPTGTFNVGGAKLIGWVNDRNTAATTTDFYPRHLALKFAGCPLLTDHIPTEVATL
jgi:hypothetical protein